MEGKVVALVFPPSSQFLSEKFDLISKYLRIVLLQNPSRVLVCPSFEFLSDSEEQLHIDLSGFHQFATNVYQFSTDIEWKVPVFVLPPLVHSERLLKDSPFLPELILVSDSIDLSGRKIEERLRPLVSLHQTFASFAT